jgi:hypothetical protein
MADNYMQGLLSDPRGEMRAPPRNALMGLLADALSGANNYANRKDPRMPGGMANPVLGLLSNALSVPSLATTADRMSYGESLTNAGKANVPFLKPETADALMMAPVSPRNALAAASMGMGGVDNGMLKSMLLYHGSTSSKPLKAIDPAHGIFGGLFASQREGAALSHGDDLYRMTVPDAKVLGQEAISSGLHDAKIAEILGKRFSGEHADELTRMVTENADMFRSDVPEDVILKAFRSDDLGEASWEAQRLRGLMSNKLGFNAVEMPDEHGMSYLVTGGVKPRPYNDSAKAKFRPPG